MKEQTACREALCRAAEELSKACHQSVLRADEGERSTKELRELVASLKELAALEKALSAAETADAAPTVTVRFSDEAARYCR